jgi:hypothetical protein
MTNALRYTENMKKTGFTENQSIAVTQMMFEHVQQTCASKTDLETAMIQVDHRFDLIDLRFNSFEEKMNDRFTSFEEKMNDRFTSFEEKMNEKFTSFEDKFGYNFMLKIGGLMVACFTVIGIWISLLVYLK